MHLQSAGHWRPVTATRWARIDRDSASARRILARHDTSGPHFTAVNAALWHRWNTALADHKLRRELKAYQPENSPGHALRIDVTASHAAAATAGYIMPSGLDDDGRYVAEYLAQRTAHRPAPRARASR